MNMDSNATVRGFLWFFFQKLDSPNRNEEVFLSTKKLLKALEQPYHWY